MANWTTEDRDQTGSVLLGRHTELATMDALAASAREGRAATVVVRGGAGIGKTSLLDAWADRQRRGGLRVLRASCAPATVSDAARAFSTVRTLLDPEVAADARRVLRGSPAEEPSFALVHDAYLLLVEVAAKGPLAVVVDDVHWSDLPSLRWLSYLSRRLEGLPVVLALSERSGEQHPTSGLLAEVVAQPDCHLVALGPLGGSDVTRMVRDTLGADADQRFCGACLEETGGNPLLLAELLGALADDAVPPSVESLSRIGELQGRLLARKVLDRLARQPDRTASLAHALAILGEQALPRAVAALSGLSAMEVASHAKQLQHIGVLRDISPIRFRHPLIRTAIATSQPPAGLPVADPATTAHILYQEGAAVRQVASALLRTDPGRSGPWTVDVLCAAARVARGEHASDSAVRYLRRALREPLAPHERAPVLVELGIEELGCAPVDAARDLREALTLTVAARERARIAGLLAVALCRARQGSLAVAALSQAAAELADQDDGAAVAGEEEDGGGGWRRDVCLTTDAHLILAALEEMTTIDEATERIEELPIGTVRGESLGERAVLAALVLHAMTGRESAARTGELADLALRGGMPLDITTGLQFSPAAFGLVLSDRLPEATTWFEGDG